MLLTSGLVSPLQLKIIPMRRWTSSDLIRNPEATFYGKVEGDSMIEAGITDGDIAVIDCSLEARDGDIVVGYVNEDFTIKYLDLTHRKDGYIELRPANKDFKPIRIDEDDDFEVWDVVIVPRLCLRCHFCVKPIFCFTLAVEIRCKNNWKNWY